ncbi:MAG: GH116 family glycosyl-hydrolase [Acidimicrobiales bacterium]
MESRNWPTVRSYVGQERRRVSLPVGGIGTGTIGFGGRGQFRDWEIENQPSIGTQSLLTFLACRAAVSGADPVARLLEGDLFEDEFEGPLGSPVAWAGLPRFGRCRFDAAYPFGAVSLEDDDFPLRAEVEVFNPLSPADPEFSGQPLVCIRVALSNAGESEVEADILFSVEAFVGHAAREKKGASQPVATSRSTPVAGYLFSDEALDREDESWGTMAAAVLNEGWLGSTWDRGKWDQGALALWRSFVATGRPATAPEHAGIATTSGRPSSLAGTVGASRRIQAGGTEEVQFLLAWHFPNRKNWEPGDAGPRGRVGRQIGGNHYTQGSTDAWELVARAAPLVSDMRARTASFVKAIAGSDLPEAYLEAALDNLSTLRSNTFFRTADGRPFGWEGCLDDAGSCLGSCTHVWNYDLATPFVFGGLAQAMREIEYLQGTGPDGAMSFRVMLPLDRARELTTTAADGQFGCVLKLYREWRLSGDTAWLRELWPACRRSIEFAWIAGGWDADHDGLAEGAQHNTMDVEYYGPNPVIQGWYLAALEAAVAMAEAVGDEGFGAGCSALLESGRKLTEERLWNGSWYRQVIVPPESFENVAPALRHPAMGANDPHDPEYQIGDGCIIDQLVGDTYAQLVGLERIFAPERAERALESIRQENRVADLGAWANGMRTYGGRDEGGYLVESYPKGLPRHPMPYWSEVWSGLEYVYAMGLMQAGRPEWAEEAVAMVRRRYDGRRRNPFDETECGHHYARPLASWGLLVAHTGFCYDGCRGRLAFAASTTPVTWFWSSGHAWGTLSQDPAVPEAKYQLTVAEGRLRLTSLVIGGDQVFSSEAERVLGPGDRVSA